MTLILKEENNKFDNLIDIFLNCLFLIGALIVSVFFSEFLSRKNSFFSSEQVFLLSLFVFVIIFVLYSRIFKSSYGIYKNAKYYLKNKKFGFTYFLVVCSIPIIHSLHLFFERNAIHIDGKIMIVDTNKLCDWHLYQYINMVELLSLNSSDEVQRLIYSSTYADYRNGLFVVAFNAWRDESIGGWDESDMLNSLERYSLYHIKIKDGIIIRELTHRQEKSY